MDLLTGWVRQGNLLCRKRRIIPGLIPFSEAFCYFVGPMPKKAKTKRKTPKKSSKKPAKKARKAAKPKKKRGAKAPKKLKKSRSVLPAKQLTSRAPADPLLSAYMREVQRYPLLTREEERELAFKFYEEKDQDAFKELVTRNLRFVVKIAYEYVNYRAKLLDLIQEGNMGLVKAVEEFNPYKDVRLTTYAVWWIRSYIQDSILKNYSLVKMGTTRAQRKLFYRLRKEQRKLESEGLVPQRNVKLLASRLDVKEKEVQEMDQRLSGRDLSLNAPTSTDERTSHMEFLAEDSEGADEVLAEREQKEVFGKILLEFAANLEGREKTFFTDRLISEKPRTLQDLGDQFGVSKERARQIEEQIKKKLKTYVQEHFPDYDLQ